MSIRDFSQYIPDFLSLSPADHIDWFGFYFISVLKQDTFISKDISNCFDELSLVKYGDITRYLNSNCQKQKGKLQKFIKKDRGEFVLSLKFLSVLESKCNLSKPKRVIKKSLRDLEPKISESAENDFYNELVACFEIGAHRASIIMIWNLTISHLFEYIFRHKITDFNSVLASNTDRRVKITSISKMEDFSEIPEGKFIEFCRQAGIVSNDVRKILDLSLGIRNTYAHPSIIKVKESKVIALIEDLVLNVIIKFTI